MKAKKIIWILSILVLASCAGTRTVDKKKSMEKQSERTDHVINKNSSEEVKSDHKTEEKKEVDQISEVEKKGSEITKYDSEKNSQKNNSERSERTEKTREYWENGNIKSEREISESISKISAEKEYWQTRAESFKEMWENSSSKIKELSSFYNTLKLSYDSKVSENENNKVIIKKQSDELQKTSQRKFYNDWKFIAIVSILLYKLLETAIKKYLIPKIKQK